MLSIFTPTYNRLYVLDKLYLSLLNQTSKKFEWIIVDDGSTDETFEQIKKWQSENDEFNIIYTRVKNGGKHRAINLAVKIASGDAFLL